MRPEGPVPGADQPRLDTAPAIAPKLLDYRPAFEAVLPPEWQLIGRCRAGEDGAATGGCFVLAHPEIGVALVDLLPMRSRQPEAQLRRLLNAVDFFAHCRGYLPIIHCEATPAEMDGLRARLEEGFAYDSVLTIADRGRWVGVLRRTLQAGVTWEALDAPMMTADPEPRAWSLRRPLPALAPLLRAGLVGCGLLGVFGLGFASALLLPPAEEAPPPAAGGTGFGTLAQVVSPPSVAPVTVAPPPMAPIVAAAAAPIATASSAPIAAATTVAPPLAGESVAAVDLPASPHTGAEVPLPASGGFGTPVAQALPGTEATEDHAAVAPPRRQVRMPLPIDRRCTEAVFRFQQGGSLSSQEMTHVRRGCASWR